MLISKRDEILTSYMLIILAASCWGFIGIFYFIAFSQGIEPMEVAFWRALLAWPLFATHALLRKEIFVAKKDVSLLILFGLLGISLFYISYLYAVKYGGAAFAAVLLYTAPAWVIASSLFIYKEKLTNTKILAVVLVITGVFLIFKTGGNSNSTRTLGIIAVLSGLTSGFCYSLYYTIGKYFSSKYSSANLFMYVLPVGALGILPFVDFIHKTPIAWAALISAALVSTYIANHCYYLGLKNLEAGKASIVATLEPVVAAIAAYSFLGEHFTIFGYVGAVMIVTAVILTIIR